MFNSRRIARLEQRHKVLVDGCNRLHDRITALESAVSPAKAPKKVEEPKYRVGDWVKILSYGNGSTRFAKYIGETHQVLRVYPNGVSLGIEDGTFWGFEEVEPAKTPESNKRKYVKSGKYAKKLTK